MGLHVHDLTVRADGTDVIKRPNGRALSRVALIDL
jgi:hypothetical protein